MNKNYEPLDREKKKILKNAMGSASSKEIDFNKVRDEWKYGDKTEDEKFEDFILFLTEIMGYNLYDYQKVFLKSMFENKATNINPFMNNKGYEKMQRYALCLRQGLSGEIEVRYGGCK